MFNAFSPLEIILTLISLVSFIALLVVNHRLLKLVQASLQRPEFEHALDQAHNSTSNEAVKTMIHSFEVFFKLAYLSNPPENIDLKELFESSWGFLNRGDEPVNFPAPPPVRTDMNAHVNTTSGAPG